MFGVIMSRAMRISQYDAVRQATRNPLSNAIFGVRLPRLAMSKRFTSQPHTLSKLLISNNQSHALERTVNENSKRKRSVAASKRVTYCDRLRAVASDIIMRVLVQCQPRRP